MKLCLLLMLLAGRAGATSWTCIYQTCTITKTWTVSPTRTATKTITRTASATRTISPTQTSTITATWTNSPTPTASPTDTRTASPTITPTATQTNTPMQTATDTPTISPSPTFTPTPSNTPIDHTVSIYWNHLCSPENSLLTDCVGGVTLTNSNVSLAISSTNVQEGSYNVTGLSGCCTSWQSALADNQNMTVQMYFYISSLASAQCLFSYTDVGITKNNALEVLTDGTFRFINYGNTDDSAAGVVTAGHIYFAAFHVGSDAMQAVIAQCTDPSCSGISGATVVNGTGTYSNMAIPVGFFQIGREAWSGAIFAANCKIDSFRISTGNLPVYPDPNMVFP